MLGERNRQNKPTEKCLRYMSFPQATEPQNNYKPF